MPFGGFVRTSCTLAEQSRIVRLPLNRVGSLNKTNRSFAELEQPFEREPSLDEIAELLGLTTSEVVDTLRTAERHVLMDASFVQGEENGLPDVLQNAGQDTPGAGMMHGSLCQKMPRALSTLTRRETDVLTLHFGFNGHAAQTLEEVGE